MPRIPPIPLGSTFVCGALPSPVVRIQPPVLQDQIPTSAHHARASCHLTALPDLSLHDSLRRSTPAFATLRRTSPLRYTGIRTPRRCGRRVSRRPSTRNAARPCLSRTNAPVGHHGVEANLKGTEPDANEKDVTIATNPPTWCALCGLCTPVLLIFLDDLENATCACALPPPVLHHVNLVAAGADGSQERPSVELLRWTGKSYPALVGKPIANCTTTCSGVMERIAPARCGTQFNGTDQAVRYR